MASDLDLVRHHEGGIETHTVFTEEVARHLAGVLRVIRGSALRDGAEVRHEYIVSHTDASALERARGLVDLEADGQWNSLIDK